MSTEPAGGASNAAPADAESNSTELSARRTGMSFQRTRMSADRTLMSVIRTSLSLIGFGFTIYQVFGELHRMGAFPGRTHAARNFGVALVALGIVMLGFGIAYEAVFMRELRRRREELVACEVARPQEGPLLGALEHVQELPLLRVK